MEHSNGLGDAAKPRCGFIGVGNRGGRVARRLLAAGFPLGMYSRHPDSLGALVDLGARGYSSPQLLAANSDVVLTMLPDDAALEDVVLGTAGLLSGIPAGSTIIDLSSVHPSTSQAISATARHGRGSALDARGCG